MHNQSEEKNSESMFIPESADFVGAGILLSNETWEHVIDASPGFIAFISPDFRILRINKAMAAFLGGEPSQYIGKLCYEVIHDSKEHIAGCPMVKIDGHHSTITTIIEKGEFGKSLVKAIPLRDAQGNLKGCLHVMEPLHSGESSAVKAETFRAMTAVLNSLPDPALLCDLHGKIQVASSSFIGLTGLNDPLLVQNSNFVSFLSYEDIEKALLSFNAVLYASKARALDTFMVRRANRDSVKAEISMNPFRGDGQTISGVLLSFRDVSGQLELEDSANKNKIRLNRFNRTFQGFSSDSSVNINRLVALLGEMLGAASCTYSKSNETEFTPVSTWKSPYMHDFDPGTVNSVILEQSRLEKGEFTFIPRPQLAAYLKENPALQEKYGLKTLLGIPIHSDDALQGILSLTFTFNYQLRNEDREFCAMVAAALALESSRTVIEQTTVVNDLNYRELFDFFTDSIAIIDQDGVFLDVNNGATKMYGYTREEFLGKNQELIAAPDKNDLEATMEAIHKAYQGESQNLEWWGIRKNGEVFPKDIVLNKGRYFGREVVIAIGRDITERKQVEEQLLKYNLELKETNQSKDKFFSILAHDLKNPFGGLLGFIDLLYEDIDDLSTDQVKEYLQNIRTASYHTYSLLENLLEWSRIQTGKVQFRPSQFDLKEEVDSVLMVLEANAIRKNVKLVNMVTDGVIAEADRNMIHSVIQNLTSNAIKFSNSNSDVTISGKYVDRVPKEDKNGSRTVTKWYEVSISDTGIGIPDDIMPKLFKLDGQFSMAGTANEPGTGLGLILCKEMVEKNGGEIRVESIQDNGSIFSFTLPLKD